MLTIRPEFLVHHETFAAVVEGRMVGFYAFGPKRDYLDLLHLWVRPEAKGRGVGRSLFLHAIGRARKLGFRILQIESDPNAEGFYRRMGATRVRRSTGTVGGHIRELPILTYELAFSRAAIR